LNSLPGCHTENDLIGAIGFDGVASAVSPSLDNQGDPYATEKG